MVARDILMRTDRSFGKKATETVKNEIPLRRGAKS